MAELRILAAGYGKFNSYTDDSNPGNMVAKAFAEEYLKADSENISEVKGYHIVVPVVWDKAWPKIKEAVEEYQPDALICIGVGGGTRFERIARNEALVYQEDAEGKSFQKPYIVNGRENPLLSVSPPGASRGRERTTPDYNSGNYQPLAVYADDKTPTPYFFPSTLPYDYLEEKMKNTSNSNILKVADELSFDAGGYLCNLAFYMPALLLHGKVGFIGFLHVEDGHDDSKYEETGKFIFNEFAHWLQRNFIRVPRDS